MNHMIPLIYHAVLSITIMGGWLLIRHEIKKKKRESILYVLVPAVTVIWIIILAMELLFSVMDGYV